MYLDPSNKLSRPRQLYLGEVKRDFVNIAKR
jgi:citrate synthase